MEAAELRRCCGEVDARLLGLPAAGEAGEGLSGEAEREEAPCELLPGELSSWTARRLHGGGGEQGGESFSGAAPGRGEVARAAASGLGTLHVFVSSRTSLPGGVCAQFRKNLELPDSRCPSIGFRGYIWLWCVA